MKPDSTVTPGKPQVVGRQNQGSGQSTMVWIKGLKQPNDQEASGAGMLNQRKDPQNTLKVSSKQALLPGKSPFLKLSALFPHPQVWMDGVEAMGHESMASWGSAGQKSPNLAVFGHLGQLQAPAGGQPWVHGQCHGQALTNRQFHPNLTWLGHADCHG